MKPRVSVLTSVYNGARFLRQAVESIHAQSFTDYEHIIVDDASTDDDTRVLLSALATESDRVRVFRHDRNRGTSAALATGVRLARGEIIAILDSDDIALPGRLASQVEYLDRNPSVGVVGGQADYVDEHQRFLRTARFPESDSEIRWALLTQSPVLHSAAAIRRSVLRCAGGYQQEPAWQLAADYFLWRVLLRHTTFANLPSVVVRYRVHVAQDSNRRNRAQRGAVWMLQQSIIAEVLGLRMPIQKVALLFDAIRGAALSTPEDMTEATALALHLRTRYCEAVHPEPRTRARIDAHVIRMLFAIAWSNDRWPRAVRVALRAVQEINPAWRRVPELRHYVRQLSERRRTNVESASLDQGLRQ